MDGNQSGRPDDELAGRAPGFEEAAGTDTGFGSAPVTDIVHVIRVLRLGGYKLKLWFNDGTAGDWDFSELATRETGPMVEPFKDPAFFNQVFIECGGLAWPNGFDWSPEALHADMAAAGVLKVESAAA
jgi:hypothetical protein